MGLIAVGLNFIQSSFAVSSDGPVRSRRNAYLRRVRFTRDRPRRKDSWPSCIHACTEEVGVYSNWSGFHPSSIALPVHLILWAAFLVLEANCRLSRRSQYNDAAVKERRTYSSLRPSIITHWCEPVCSSWCFFSFMFLLFHRIIPTTLSSLTSSQAESVLSTI